MRVVVMYLVLGCVFSTRAAVSGIRIERDVVVYGSSPAALTAAISVQRGDKCVQAYCFRMCLTDVPENRIPFSKPEGYDERDYELLLRNYEAGETGIPWINSKMPNRKLKTAERPVALAAYTMDSHHVRRYVTKEGWVKNEGDVEVVRLRRSRSTQAVRYRSFRTRLSQHGSSLTDRC